MTNRGGALALALTLAVGSAFPQTAGVSQEVVNGFLTGNGLLAACQSTDNGQRGLCIGYIEGVFDTMAISLSYLGKDQCPRTMKGVTGKQIGDLVLNYLREHPEDRHTSAARIVSSVIALGFHCLEASPSQR
jgi:hypothetical protein